MNEAHLVIILINILAVMECLLILWMGELGGGAVSNKFSLIMGKSNGCSGRKVNIFPYVIPNSQP